MKGSYILIIFLDKKSVIKIGSLGKISFSKGFYLYVGSAMGNSGSTTLINRIKRHTIDSKLKKLHWHLDHLLNHPNSKIIRLYLIPSMQSLECIISEELNEISDVSITNFGSSDCKCRSHLFYFKDIKFLFKDHSL